MVTIIELVCPSFDCIGSNQDLFTNTVNTSEPVVRKFRWSGSSYGLFYLELQSN